MASDPKIAARLRPVLSNLKRRVPFVDFVVWRHRSGSLDFQDIASTVAGVTFDCDVGNTIPTLVLAKEEVVVSNFHESVVNEEENILAGHNEDFTKRKWKSAIMRNITFGDECLIVAAFSKQQNYYATRRNQTLTFTAIDLIREIIIDQYTIKTQHETASRVSKNLFKLNTAEVAGNHLHDIKDVLHQMEDPLQRIARILDRNKDLGGASQIHLLQVLVERAKTLSTRFIEQVRDNRIRQERVNIYTLIEPTLAHFRVQSRFRQVSFTTPLTPAPPIYVLADAHRFHSVLNNVISNALYWACHPNTQSGGRLRVPTIELDVFVMPTENRCYVTVKDNGPGMISVERAMELGYSSRPGGTGMGLPIAQTIMTEHRGALSIDSSPGRGTTVKIAIPLAPG
jgi:signal transduction histidine kinase